MPKRQVAPPGYNENMKAGLRDTIQKADLLNYLPIGRAKSAFRIIHPEDRQVMMKVIDYARLRQPQNLATELDASRLAEHYGIRAGKTLSGLANNFERTLDAFKQRNYPAWKKTISEGVRNFGE